MNLHCFIKKRCKLQDRSRFMKLLLLHGLGQGPGSWDGVLDALTH